MDNKNGVIEFLKSKPAQMANWAELRAAGYSEPQVRYAACMAKRASIVVSEWGAEIDPEPSNNFHGW